MNQFFYETRGKEKLKELRREGQISQALHKSSAPKPGHLPGAPTFVGVPKAIMIVLGILSFLGLRGH